MGRIQSIFEHKRSQGDTALLPFITGGHPTLRATQGMLQGLSDAGASICEVGIPFSDPIADGPVIAGAMHRALTDGTTVDDVLHTISAARSTTELGLVAMVSQSIVHRRGHDAFVRTLAEAGFDGLIVPDIDLDRADALLPTIDELGLSFSLLVAPTTTSRRLPSLLKRCRGFVYLLARAGITGTSSDLTGLDDRAQQLRQHTDLPIAAGFGIASPEHVKAVTSCCDGAIVGSALVQRMDESDDPVEAGLAFVSTLAEGLSQRQ